MRGCTAGLVTRWSWYDWPADIGDPPGIADVDDIGIRKSTGSCWRVVSVKPSRRKGKRWYVMHMEGLGVDAASLDDEGTFRVGSMSYEDLKVAEQIEQMEAAHVPAA